MVSLMGNPVAQKPNYRLHLIARVPSLKVIDFVKVKPRVRSLSSPFFFFLLLIILKG